MGEDHNDIDPQAWLADVLARIADMPQTRCTGSSPGTGRPDSIEPSRPDLRHLLNASGRAHRLTHDAFPAAVLLP